MKKTASVVSGFCVKCKLIKRAFPSGFVTKPGSPAPRKPNEGEKLTVRERNIFFSSLKKRNKKE